MHVLSESRGRELGPQIEVDVGNDRMDGEPTPHIRNPAARQTRQTMMAIFPRPGFMAAPQ